jgi:hypothetical protein
VAVTDAPVDAERRDRRSVRKPRRSRYLLAVPLLVVGLALALGVGLVGAQAKSDRAAGFARIGVPGVLTLRVDQPATYFIYPEGTACLDSPNCHGEIYPVTVKVTGPTGDSVNVQPSRGPDYMIDGMQTSGIAKFDAAMTGNYRVAVSTGPYAEGQVAVGEAFPWWTQDWVAWLATSVVWAGGVAIIVLPFATHRRRTRSVPLRR